MTEKVPVNSENNVKLELETHIDKTILPNHLLDDQNINDDVENDNLLKLFVGGLNYLSLQSDIKSYFETFGKVLNCSLLIDKVSSKSRGFAFVTIDDISGEIKDKILTRKHEINGKIVDVKLAVEGKKREEMLDASRKIFVGGLDPTVTNDDLKNFFTKFGDVREAVVLFDNNRGASRCFGFVTFDSKDTVDRLVKENNYQLKGKQIDVKQALPKALQKTQNIISQSGIDLLLNPKAVARIFPKSDRPGMPSMYEYGQFGMVDEYPMMDDRAFVDYITNPFSNTETEIKKYRENNSYPNDYLNFGNMYPSYEQFAKSTFSLKIEDVYYGAYKPRNDSNVGFKPY